MTTNVDEVDTIIGMEIDYGNKSYGKVISIREETTVSETREYAITDKDYAIDVAAILEVIRVVKANEKRNTTEEVWIDGVKYIKKYLGIGYPDGTDASKRMISTKRKRTATLVGVANAKYIHPSNLIK
jgi:hypothetical protein